MRDLETRVADLERKADGQFALIVMLLVFDLLLIVAAIYWRALQLTPVSVGG